MEIRWRQPIILGGLIFVVISALWVGPKLVSQEVLRRVAAQQLQRALAHGVTVDGPIGFALLPQPKLVAADVKLSRNGQQVASLPRFEAILQIAPLFRGRMQPDELRLVRPAINLRQAKATPAEPSGEAPQTAAPAAPPVPVAAPSIPSIIVEQGSISWGSGATLAPLDAKVSVKEGEFSLTGHTVWRGVGFGVIASAGSQGSDVNLHLDRGGELHWHGQDQGKLTGKIADLSLLSDRLPAMPAALSADIHWGAGQVEAGNILLSLGDADWHGKGSLALGTEPKAELALRGSTLDLDRWPTPKSTPVSNPEPEAAGAAAPVIAASNGFTANISLTADQLLWRGKLLRDAKLILQTGNGATIVHQASVTLPGNSEVALFGEIGDGPSFAGSFEGKSDDFRQLLRWAGSDPAQVPADRLHAAKINGEIKAQGDEVGFDKVHLKIDSSQADLSGAWKPGDLSVHFAIDTLNADAYWQQREKTPTAPTPAAAPVSEAPAARPQAIAFDGVVSRLSWHGVTLENVAVTGANTGAIKLKAHTQDLGRTLRGFGLDLPMPAPADAEATIDGSKFILDRLSSDLYGGQLAGTGSFAPDGMALHLALHQAQMKQALLDVADIGLADGTLEAETDLSGADFQSHLNGTAHLAVTNGQIKGFDLKAADRTLAEKPNIGGLLMLLQSGLTGGSTHFSSLTGSARITNGVIVSDDLKLVADGGGASGAAKIDLPGNSIDSHADFRFASAADAPPLTMRMVGSLQNPHRYLDIKPLQTWLAEHGVKGAKPKDVLKSLLQGLSK
jgi:hypothetical protein